MASIFLSSKIEEHPRRCRDVINVFYYLSQLREGKEPELMRHACEVNFFFFCFFFLIFFFIFNMNFYI